MCDVPGVCVCVCVCVCVYFSVLIVGFERERLIRTNLGTMTNGRTNKKQQFENEGLLLEQFHILPLYLQENVFGRKAT